MECGQSGIRIAQPPVGGRLDGSRSRWSLVSLSAKVSGCGIFPSSPQVVVPDAPSGVDFLSPVLSVSSREFRPESSDVTGL